MFLKETKKSLTSTGTSVTRSKKTFVTAASLTSIFYQRRLKFSRSSFLPDLCFVVALFACLLCFCCDRRTPKLYSLWNFQTLFCAALLCTEKIRRQICVMVPCSLCVRALRVDDNIILVRGWTELEKSIYSKQPFFLTKDCSKLISSS